MRYIKKYWIVFIVIFVLLMLIKPILCLLMLGLTGILIGTEAAFFLKKLQINGTECEGKIVGYETDIDGDKIPLVEFTTAKGEFVKEKTFVYSSVNLIDAFALNKMIDKSVLVLYDPDDPKRFVFVNGNNNNSLSIFIIILVCLTFVIISICVLMSYIKIG